MKNSFAPVFSKMLDSSLWEESYTVRLLFVTMLVLQDSDHVVRFNSYQLHRRANMKLEEVEAALKVLLSPDPKRPGQAHDGRRIQEVEDGWLMLNGQYYEDQMRVISRRMYQARKQREYRAHKSGKPLAGETTFLKSGVMVHETPLAPEPEPAGKPSKKKGGTHGRRTKASENSQTQAPSGRDGHGSNDDAKSGGVVRDGQHGTDEPSRLGSGMGDNASGGDAGDTTPGVDGGTRADDRGSELAGSTEGALTAALPSSTAEPYEPLPPEVAESFADVVAKVAAKPGIELAPSAAELLAEANSLITQNESAFGASHAALKSSRTADEMNKDPHKPSKRVEGEEAENPWG